MYHKREKKPFVFSHCWIILNGRPKWTQLVACLKASKKRNDGSSSHQSIGLDDEEEDVVVENGRATMPKDNRQVMEKKWEKARASCDAARLRLKKCHPHGWAFFRQGRTRKRRGTSSCWMHKYRGWSGTERGQRRRWK